MIGKQVDHRELVQHINILQAGQDVAGLADLCRHLAARSCVYCDRAQGEEHRDNCPLGQVVNQAMVLSEKAAGDADDALHFTTVVEEENKVIFRRLEEIGERVSFLEARIGKVPIKEG